MTTDGFSRRRLLGGWLVTAVAIAGAFSPAHVGAHHGWAWATDEQFEITGTIKKVRLGNPHGELTLDVKGETWEAEIGQPWRNQRAGLKDELLKAGVVVTISGHRAKDPKIRVVKAERVTIDGKTYDLYPDRGS